MEHGGEGALSKLSEELDKRVTSETRARRVRAPRRRRMELINQLVECPRSDIPSWGRAPPLIHNHTPKGGADLVYLSLYHRMQSAVSLDIRPLCPLLSLPPA